MARKHGLTLRDPARPELGWQQINDRRVKGADMTSPTNTRPKWPFHVIATVVVFVLAALAVAGPSSASKHNRHEVYVHKHKVHANKHKVDGVGAKIKHGTLEVKGSNRADTVALRLKAGDPTRVQLDVDDDGSADFTFARNDVSAINVKMGKGNDSVRIDDANGAFAPASSSPAPRPRPRRGP